MCTYVHMYKHFHLYLCHSLLRMPFCYAYTRTKSKAKQSKGSAAKLMAKATFAASSCWWAAPYIDTCTLYTKIKVKKEYTYVQISLGIKEIVRLCGS